MHESVVRMWRAYQQSWGLGEDAPPEAISAWHFCDNEEDADLCARLVMEGRKRATTPSVWSFQSRGEPLPEVGDLHVVTNWAGEAQCVIETTQVEVMPFRQVNAEQAQAEGEGDGTLPWWRKVHWAYYQREMAGSGEAPNPQMPVVCERFRRVYPPLERADG